MSILALALASSLTAAPTTVDERPLWAGSLRPGDDTLVASAAADGFVVRSANGILRVSGDASSALGAGLCPGDEPRLGIAAGTAVAMIAPGTPARLVASVLLPAQAISAAVPVSTPAGCRLAVALQTGDVALVDPAGGLSIVAGVVPAVLDWHELPRGVLVASRKDLLVVGGVDGAVAAVRFSDGRRYSGSSSGTPVPGAVWTEGEDTLWFLGKSGTLHAWKVTTGAPQVVVAGSVAAPGGLVSWSGRRDRGIAWADLQGQVWTWKGGAALPLVRLPAGVRWPLLVADLDDGGDLKLVAVVDGQVAALVTEAPDGGSFTLLPLVRRPAGPPVAWQMTPDAPAVLAVPAGPLAAVLHPADAPPAGQLATDLAILTPGSQIRGLTPEAMQAALVVPPYGGGTSGTAGGAPGGTGPSAGGAATAPAKSGFSCATAPSADALPVLLAPLLLLRRRRSPTAAQGRSGVTNDREK